MDENSVLNVFSGYKFKFAVKDFDEYLIESRKISEKLLKIEEFSLENSIKIIKEHLIEKKVEP